MVKRERMCEDESQDGMRLIPDEVLLSILSLLSFKDATATTRVARRWRYLYGWIRKLDLDGTESLYNLLRLFYTIDPLIKISYIEFKQRYSDLTHKYIRWVESVLANQKSSTLEEFRLLYTLDESHTDLIDSWLRFAVSRKVEKLELDLTPHAGYKLERYTFPYKNGSELGFIRKLCTNWANVSGEAVASFLQNCPLLEHLSVSNSLVLSSLEVVNTFPTFKCLEIYMCFYLKSVVIRDSNIVVLKIFKRELYKIHQFDVRNVPLLTEIWTEDISLYLFSTVLPQIEMLKLYITRRNPRERKEDEVRSLGVDDMSNLKQLVVVDGDGDDNTSLLYLINFLKRSYELERFVLEAPVYHDGSGASKENIPDLLLPIIPMKERLLYPCLKEIKLAMNGYASRQFELMMHFVESGVALKNIVVDAHVLEHPMLYHLGCGWDDSIRQTQTSKRALEMARALHSILPSTITLTILN